MVTTRYRIAQDFASRRPAVQLAYSTTGVTAGFIGLTRYKSFFLYQQNHLLKYG